MSSPTEVIIYRNPLAFAFLCGALTLWKML